MAFTYHSIHAGALAHGRDWFLADGWPRHGALPQAFNWQTPFDAEGRPATIDRPPGCGHRRYATPG